MNSDFAPNGNVFLAAVQWLQGTLLGSVATTVAVIAVASVGFLLLSGRVDVRRAAQVIFGCFILFGASTIAAGLVGAMSDKGDGAQASATPPPPATYPPSVVQQPRPATPFDPYAGAALPRQ